SVEAASTAAPAVGPTVEAEAEPAVAEEPAPERPGSWFEPPEADEVAEPLPTAATPLLDVLGPSGTGADLVADPAAPAAPVPTGMVAVTGAVPGVGFDPAM